MWRLMEEKPTSRAHDKTKVIIMPVIHDAEWRFNLFICILFSEELFACSDRAHHITTYDALQWERKISRTPSSKQPTLKRSGRFYKQNTRSFVLLALSSSRSASRVCVCVCVWSFCAICRICSVVARSNALLLLLFLLSFSPHIILILYCPN